MKKRRKLIWALAAAAVIVIAVIILMHDDEELVVRTYTVEDYTVINTVTATGTIQPVEQVTVGTQVSGEIDKIFVDYNSEVKKGQILAELDKSNLLENVRQAEASLKSAESELEYSSGNFERTKLLYEANATTKVNYEEASNDLVKAETQLQNAKSNLDQAKVNLGYSEIYSPIDGVVLSREVEEGQTVAASYSTPTLFTIANDLTQMKVEADVDEADIGQVKEGQKVEFTVDAYINDVFHGEVQQIRLEPTTTNNVVTYTVIIEAPNPDYKLLPGMTASVTIVTEEHSGLAVPVEALNFTPSQKVMESFDKNDARAKNSHATAMMPGKENRDSEMVWVLNEGVMTPRFISTDISDGVYKIVRNGVAEGDSIVLSANFVTKKQKTSRQDSNPFMPTPPGRILKIENLRRTFMVGGEEVHALKGVSFEIYPGEFVSIMGSSGSGKSTMLNILGCLDTPTSGTYYIDGISVKDRSRNELADIRNHKIGFVFQSYNLLPRTSAIENVELPLLYNNKISVRERRERAIEALELVGLKDRMEHMPNQLSGGQQQRVAIARAIVNDPVILLADEATGNLDTRTSFEIMSLFQELNGKGKTIAFVTHESDIATFTSRTIMLRDGHIISDGKAEYRSARKALEEMPPDIDE